jgi:NADH-quinone oxidoreductase subunit N
MNPSTSLGDFQQTTLVLIPELILLFTAVGIMTGAAFISRPRRFWCATSAGALLLALLALFNLSGRETGIYSAVALNDDLSFYARLVLLLTGLLLVALAHREPEDERAGEFFGALLMIDAGAMLVAAANEVVFLFVGLELVSIPTYLLLYLSQRNRSTQEAATKYFFLSIFSSALLLYGLAFLYGTLGISNLKAIGFLFDKLNGVPQLELGLIAVVFVMAGLCFRVAAVPLHFYAPDVYQGSPLVIAAALAWVPKAVGFLAIVRALTAVLAAKAPGDPLAQKAVMLSWAIAAATMIWGNFVALLQDNLKRLLAYSSIAHAGYMMVGVTASFANDSRGGGVYYGAESIFFYLVAYALMTLGAFGVFSALRIRGQVVETVDDLAGLGATHPWPALALSICLLSLSGIPPLLGFWAKFEIFAALLAAGQRSDAGSFMVLAVIGMLSAAAGAYYYLRLIVVMYFRPCKEEVQIGGGWPVALAVGACASLTVMLGLFSAPLSGAAHAAAQAAMDHPSPERPRLAATVNSPFARAQLFQQADIQPR